MKHRQKQVCFYKRGLLNGSIHHLEADDALSLRLRDEQTQGAYFSRTFDTGGEGTTFHRLTLEGAFEGVHLEVVAAALDTDSCMADNAAVSLTQFLADAQISLEKKRAVLLGLPNVRAADCRDLLLRGLQGRFVWVAVLVRAEPRDAGGFRLDGMRLEFPLFSFTDYFPEIYQGNDFFERFVAVFQSIYLDLEREADAIPAMLDYESTSDEKTEQLARWLGIRNPGGILTPGQIRLIMRELPLYQGGKGTRRTLIRLLALVTNARPYIVEYFQWSRLKLSEEQRALFGRLYGEGGGSFCVLLDFSTQSAPLPRARLERLIEEYSMIGTRFKLVYLSRCCRTDTHCYLDVNSILSVPKAASVDGTFMGDYITVG